jgi:hypothetical protein
VGGLRHKRGGDYDYSVNQVSLGREPDVIRTGDLEGAATRAFEDKAALSVGEVEQHGTLRYLARTEHWSLAAGWDALALGSRGRGIRICRRGLLREQRCEREKQCTQDRRESCAQGTMRSEAARYGRTVRLQSCH